MIALVTGVAGFIGSNLANALLQEGWQVRGIDARDVDGDLVGRLEVTRSDLLDADLESLVDGVDAVFHLAAQTGVRTSWSDFDLHVRNNVQTTQRLLEATRRVGGRRFVLASSSSVYGNASTTGDANRAAHEDDGTRPFSPYGVTKRAAEQLCRVYADNFDVSTVVLRYFTVYGPGQRRDMSIHRLIDAALHATPFELYGNGAQSRDFTFVDDIVRATIDAATASIVAGTAINIGGGSTVAMSRLIETIEAITERSIDVRYAAAQPGDVNRTAADISRAAALLRWKPEIDLPTGLNRQVSRQAASTCR